MASGLVEMTRVGGVRQDGVYEIAGSGFAGLRFGS